MAQMGRLDVEAAEGAGGHDTGGHDRGGGDEVCNEVRLRGRVSAEPELRALPSGVLLVSLRVVVPRPPDPRAVEEGRRAATVDTIDVACWPGAAQEQAVDLAAGDHVEVRGALRRRFYQTPGGAQSRYEVQVETIALLHRDGGVVTDHERAGRT